MVLAVSMHYLDSTGHAYSTFAQLAGSYIPVVCIYSIGSSVSPVVNTFMGNIMGDRNALGTWGECSLCTLHVVRIYFLTL